MSSNLSNDYKQQVQTASDIVKVISQSVELKKRGKDFLGLCPFHQEKTPSFHVNPAKQMFYCYGCKAGGDVFTFIMKRDRIEFVDALRDLGNAAGIREPENTASNTPGSERKKLIDANDAACTFFETQLASSSGASAREYLQQRGFSADSIRNFRIGLAQDSWDSLLRSPVGRKFPAPLLLTAGLIKARDSGSGFYDTFRNRIIFPIRSDTGQIIAFGGRVAPGSPDPAKYLNSPETPLFSKSRAIFGFDLARQKMAESRTATVVEGYTDVVMAHQFGANNVVSVLGTAMTVQHVQLLRRFTDKIVLLFDADTAGDLAVDRVVELFLTQPIEIAIASLPDGLDPDEYLLQYGLDSFNRLIATGTDVLSYKWKQLVRHFKAEAGNLTGQQQVLERYLELLAGARGVGPVDPLRWGTALARVSRLSDIPIDELNRRFRAQKRGPTARSRSENTEAAPEVSRVHRQLTGRDRAERWIIGALLLEPLSWHKVQMELHIDDFVDPLHRQLAQLYWHHQLDEGEPILAEFLGSLVDSELRELAITAIQEIEAIVRPVRPPADNNTRPHKPSVEELAGEPTVAKCLASAIEYLKGQKESVEQQKLVAQLRRTTEGQDIIAAEFQDARTDSAQNPIPMLQHEVDEVALLAEIVKKSQKPNLHRSGPVSRSRA